MFGWCFCVVLSLSFLVKIDSATQDTSPSSTSTKSNLIPGPSEVITYRDGNETITVDFSDIEFHPIDAVSFPLFTSSRSNIGNKTTVSSYRPFGGQSPGGHTSDGLSIPSTDFEKTAVKKIITAVDIDSVNGLKAGRILSLSDLPSLHAPPGHPLYQGTPDYSKSYGLSSLGPANFGTKKFTALSVEGDFGQGNVRHYATVRLQNKVNFGRRIVRYAMFQSLNEKGGNPRHIWLTDANMWRETTLKPLGRLMTPAGFALMWTI